MDRSPREQTRKGQIFKYLIKWVLCGKVIPESKGTFRHFTSISKYAKVLKYISWTEKFQILQKKINLYIASLFASFMLPPQAFKSFRT